MKFTAQILTIAALMSSVLAVPVGKSHIPPAFHRLSLTPLFSRVKLNPSPRRTHKRTCRGPGNYILPFPLLTHQQDVEWVLMMIGD